MWLHGLQPTTMDSPFRNRRAGRSGGHSVPRWSGYTSNAGVGMGLQTGATSGPGASALGAGARRAHSCSRNCPHVSRSPLPLDLKVDAAGDPQSVRLTFGLAAAPRAGDLASAAAGRSTKPKSWLMRPLASIGSTLLPNCHDAKGRAAMCSLRLANAVGWGACGGLRRHAAAAGATASSGAAGATASSDAATTWRPAVTGEQPSLGLP